MEADQGRGGRSTSRRRSRGGRGGGEEPDGAIGGSDGGEHGDVGVIGDEAGLVDDQDVDAVDAAFAVGVIGHGADGTAVAEDQDHAVDALDAEGNGGLEAEVAHAKKQSQRLPPGSGDDEHFLAGIAQKAMEGLEGGDGGLAPLASAAEKQPFAGFAQEAALDGIGLEAERGRELEDILGDIDGRDGGAHEARPGFGFQAGGAPEGLPSTGNHNREFHIDQAPFELESCPEPGPRRERPHPSEEGSAEFAFPPVAMAAKHRKRAKYIF